MLLKTFFNLISWDLLEISKKKSDSLAEIPCKNPNLLVKLSEKGCKTDSSKPELHVEIHNKVKDNSCDLIY